MTLSGQGAELEHPHPRRVPGQSTSVYNIAPSLLCFPQNTTQQDLDVRCVLVRASTFGAGSELNWAELNAVGLEMSTLGPNGPNQNTSRNQTNLKRECNAHVVSRPIWISIILTMPLWYYVTPMWFAGQSGARVRWRRGWRQRTGDACPAAHHTQHLRGRRYFTIPLACCPCLPSSKHHAVCTEDDRLDLIKLHWTYQRKTVHDYQILGSLYFFWKNGAKSGFEVCFNIGSQHLGCRGRITFRIQNKEVYATLCLQVHD